MQARVLLLKNLRQHFRERDYDYKRFKVDAQQEKDARMAPESGTLFHTNSVARADDGYGVESLCVCWDPWLQHTLEPTAKPVSKVTRNW